MSSLSGPAQYAREGVRINAVCPGWILTPATQGLVDQGAETVQRLLQHQPIDQIGAPEEVTAAVVWLCSDAASLVVGVSMPVDGGYTAV